MDAEDIKRVNRLWEKVYPYLAAQVMENYGRDSGTVLELGPFSGGISRELAKKYPKLDITVRDWGLGTGGWRPETGNRGLGLEDSDKFDLIIFRGAFFFLGKKDLLRNIFRALKDGGMAFFGGGYGKGIPQEIIDEIADESRILNDRLGRRRYSLEDLKKHVKNAGLEDNCRIEEEGGVWLVIRK